MAQAGWAVLRADSRGIGRSQGEPWPANTKADIASDVRAELRYLQNRTEIDACRIGLVGHSEGASVAAMVAGQSRDVAFIIMLAGPGLSGDEVLCQQIGRVGNAFGVAGTAIDRYVQLLRAATATLRDYPDESQGRREFPSAGTCPTHACHRS